MLKFKGTRANETPEILVSGLGFRFSPETGNFPRFPDPAGFVPRPRLFRIPERGMEP